MLEKPIDVAYCKLGAFLRDMDGAEVVGYWLGRHGMVGSHEIS